MSVTKANSGRVGAQSWAAHLAPLALTAVLLMLAFPKPGWGWLAHVALVPAVMVAVRSASARRLLIASYAVSAVWWLVMIAWLIPVTVGGYIGLSLYMAIYLPLALLAVRFLDNRLRAPLTLTLPLVWVSLEFLRCTIWQGGFAWFALAHTQAAFTESSGPGRLIQVADLFGQWGVSFIVVMTNGLIADLLTRPIFRSQGHGWHGRMNRTMRAALLLWAFVMVGAIIYGQFRIQQTDRFIVPGPRVAVVQTNVPQDNKDSTDEQQIIDNWRRMVALTERAATSDQVDLIVWPETMVPAALNDDAIRYYATTETRMRGYEAFHHTISDLAREVDSALMVGAVANFQWRRIEMPDGRTYEMPRIRYNSAFLYDRDGQQARDRYDKMHRVPFGEYMPYVDTMPWLRGIFAWFSPYDFDYDLRAGTSNTVFELDWRHPPIEDSAQQAFDASPLPPVRVVTPICFEDAVSQVVGRMIYDNRGHKRADVIVNLTNDGWFSGTHQPFQHLQIAVLRSVENRVPTARSVNTGISGFIDSAGRIGPLVRVQGSPVDVEGFAVHDVQLDTRRTLFGRIGLFPVGAVMALTAGLLALATFKARRAL